jgi:hypothetical protein
VKTNFEALNLAVVTDEFDDDTFDENVDTEHTLRKTMKQQGARAMKSWLGYSIWCPDIKSYWLGFILHRWRVESIKVEAYNPSRLSEP